jgi:hypothetical protein
MGGIMIRAITSAFILFLLGVTRVFGQEATCDAVLAKDTIMENYQNRVSLSALMW